MSFAWRRVTSRIASSPRGATRRRRTPSASRRRESRRRRPSWRRRSETSPREWRRWRRRFGARQSFASGGATVPVFPPCNFFAAEEGTRTLDLLRTLGPRDRRFRADGTDPLRTRSNSPTPEPAAPRDDFFMCASSSTELSRRKGAGDVPSESARDGRRHRASDPSDGFSAARREAFARTYPRAIERFRAVSRLRRRRLTPRIITSRG